MGLSSRLGIPILFVECRATVEKTIERLKERRQQTGEISDATVAVYFRQREEFAPLSEIPDPMRLIVTTEGDPDEAARRVLDSLRRLLSNPGRFLSSRFNVQGPNTG
jgi:predicted kinase